MSTHPSPEALASLQTERLTEISAEERGLTEYLRKAIVDLLLLAEVNGYRDQVRDWILTLWDPRESAVFQLLQLSFTRMHRFDTRFKRAWRDREVHVWVTPQVAAVAFEGVFETCALFWLQDGPPPDPEELSPAVERFVRNQVDLFALAIGAER